MDIAHQLLVYTQLATWKILYAASRAIVDRAPEREERDAPNKLWEEFAVFVSEPGTIYEKSDHRGALYVGSAKNAADWNFFQRCEIGAVVNVTEEVSNFYQDRDIHYHSVAVRDDATSEMSIENLVSAADFIEAHLARGTSVLVHCFMGRSRSVAVTCMHGMRHVQKRFETARNAIKLARPAANMNRRFINLLEDYDKDNLQKKEGDRHQEHQDQADDNSEEVVSNGYTSGSGETSSSEINHDVDDEEEDDDDDETSAPPDSSPAPDTPPATPPATPSPAPPPTSPAASSSSSSSSSFSHG